MAQKQRIAVIGANGFVGSAICRAAESFENLKIISVVRGMNLLEACQNADVVIHTANTGRRYWANQNPEKDFLDSVEKTKQFKQLLPDKKFLLVSSISARTQLDTAYGKHRKSCELLMDPKRDLVVRLGAMYGGEKIGGALSDLLNHKTVYVAETTRYAFVDVNYCGRKLLEVVNQTGLIELGARTSIELSDLKKRLKSKSEFEGIDDSQIPIDPPEDAPSADEIFSYLSGFRLKCS